MKVASRGFVSFLSSTSSSSRLVLAFAPHARCLHTTTSKPATPLPFAAAGPPPSAPLPAASQYGERVDRRRRQAELLKRGQDLRASAMKPGSAMKKRFWKDVSVKTTPGTLSQPLLDLRQQEIMLKHDFQIQRATTPSTSTPAPSDTPPPNPSSPSLPQNPTSPQP